MSDLKEMSKKAVEEMLQKRAQLALELDELDKQFEDVFCGVHLDTERVLHIYKTETLKEIANKLEVPVVVDPYLEEDKERLHPYLGQMWFPFECCGKKWKVFALYEDESEVVV